jgi:hypothetical protein
MKGKAERKTTRGSHGVGKTQKGESWDKGDIDIQGE